MAAKKPTLVVAPKREPSFLNRTAFVGLGAGMLLGSIAPFTVPLAGPIGAGIGSLVGKARMQDEKQTGKVVKPPSSWNFGTFAGATSAFGISSLVGLSTMVLTGAMASATSLLTLGAVTIGTGGLALPVIAAVAGITALGGFLGGKIAKQFQKREYNAAEMQVMQEGPFRPPHAQERGDAPQPMQGMAPQQQPQQGMEQAPAGDVAKASQKMDPQQLAQLQAMAQQAQRMAPQHPAQESMADKVAQQQRPNSPPQRGS